MTTTLSPMTPRRRSEIRAMLVDHVARETAPADPLISRPPRPAWRRGLRPVVGVAVVTAAAAVVSVGIGVGNPTPSYASWQAVPQTAPGAAVTDSQINAWASKCSELGVGGIGIEGVPPRKVQAARRDVLVDRRGDFTFCVDVALGHGTAQDPLIAMAGIRADLGPEADDSLNTMAGTVYDKPFARPRGNDVLVLGGDLTDWPPLHDDGTVKYLKAYQLCGLAGPDVDAVKIVLSNGTVVTATVHHGLWGAWWPADKGAASGTRLQVRSGAESRLLDPRSVTLPLP